MYQVDTEKINILILKSGLKGYELAKELGITAQYVSNIKKSKTTPSIDLLIKMIKIFLFHS